MLLSNKYCIIGYLNIKKKEIRIRITKLPKPFRRPESKKYKDG